MKNVLFLSLLCAALAAPAAAQQGNQPNPAGEPSATTQDAGAMPAKKGHGHGKHNERHPMIHRAMMQLKNAKASLEKAEHEFGGHREKALDLTNQAISELDQALKYHEEHEGQEKNEGDEKK